MKKPRTLYCYNSKHELMQHRLTRNCIPQVEIDSSTGTLFRCRYHENPHVSYFYGYATRKEALQEDYRNIQSEIAELTHMKQKVAAKLLKL